MIDNIYSYLEIVCNIKVSDYVFERDYIIYPLQKYREPLRNQLSYELPIKEDFIYLYLDLNLSQKQLKSLFNVSMLIINKAIKQYNIIKDRKLGILNRNKTNLAKYGIEAPSKLQYIKEKQKQTNIKKYGCVSSTQNSLVKQKMIQTNLERYGVENVFQNNYIKDKSKKTKLEKYGNENYTNRKKSCQTKLEKYGNKYYNNFKQIQQTNIEKYGNCCYLTSIEGKEKALITNIEKYGNNFYLGSKQHLQHISEYMEKIYKTKKKNKSFNTSKPEKIIYETLLSKFDDVQTQYKSELYPYKCDFYITELDLFIEYNGFWMHGKEQYIGTNEQNERVKLWEYKNTPQYTKAIHTWTIKDVEKRNIARQNNLNYLEFFNMNNFYEWFETII